jgi:hypothetical protein
MWLTILTESEMGKLNHGFPLDILRFFAQISTSDVNAFSMLPLSFPRIHMRFVRTRPEVLQQKDERIDRPGHG